MLLMSIALAQHVDVDAYDVLTPDDLPYEASAIGHPALWTTDSGVAIVFDAAIEVPGCAEASQMGHATSTDGLTWTVSSTVIGPTASAPCGFHEPIVADTSDGLLILARAVHDGTYWARRWHERRVTFWQPTGLDGLEDLSIARRDGSWVGMGVDPAVGMVTVSSADAHTWTQDAQTAVPYGTTWWSDDGLYSPSLSCFDGLSTPWVMHYGGWTGGDSGFTWGVSNDMNVWFVSSPIATWTGPDAWDAWDAIASRTDAWVVFATGGHIGWASTSADAPAGTASRDCLSSP